MKEKDYFCRRNEIKEARMMSLNLLNGLIIIRLHGAGGSD